MTATTTTPTSAGTAGAPGAARSVVPLVRAELLRVRHGRAARFSLLGMAGLVALYSLGSAVHATVPTAADRVDELVGRFGGIFGGAVAFLLGLLAVTQAFQHGTIAQTYLTQPRRARVLAAQLTAAVLAGAATALVAAATAAVVSGAIVTAKGLADQLHPGHLAALVAAVVTGGGLVGALGAAVGAILRKPVRALTVTAFWFVFVEGLIGQLQVPFPLTSFFGTIGLFGRPSPPYAAALVVWVVLLTGIATAWFLGRDLGE